MIFLINRPIAVIALFISLVAIGFFCFFRIPISLLPSISVPQLTLTYHAPNKSSSQISSEYSKNLTQALSGLKNLEDLEVTTKNEFLTIKLFFSFGSDMSEAFSATNDILDRNSHIFPTNSVRPIITQLNPSDIPLLRLHITPKVWEESAEFSDFINNSIKRKIQQIEGIGIVDINGKTYSKLSIVLRKESMDKHLLTSEDISAALSEHENNETGVILSDSQYEFILTLNNKINKQLFNEIEVENKKGTKIPLSEVADIVEITNNIQSARHFFNDKQSIVLNIHKQDKSRMNSVVKEIYREIEQFKRDYPNYSFQTSQDQSFLLDAGIDNLNQDIIYGGILTILLVIALLGKWRLCILMILNIPLSLIISFIFFKLFDLSFNIISLSGLALAVGMTIDTSIVVIDSINGLLKGKKNLIRSIIVGSKTIFVPVLSQVLTTIAVYIPLIFLSGLAGIIVKDQCIALTICLLVSLFVAFILTPVLFYVLFKQADYDERRTGIYEFIRKNYHLMLNFILKKPKLFLIIVVGMMPFGILIAFFMPFKILPDITNADTVVDIEWNKNISLAENLRRFKELEANIHPKPVISDADIGITQYINQLTANSNQHLKIYYLAKNSENLNQIKLSVRKFIASNYSNTNITFFDSPNAFNQLFAKRNNFFSVKFRNNSEESLIKINRIINSVSLTGLKLDIPHDNQTVKNIVINSESLVRHQVREDALSIKLKSILQIQDKEIVYENRVQSAEVVTKDQILDQTVLNNNGIQIPLSALVTLMDKSEKETIISDKIGDYISASTTKENIDIQKLEKTIYNMALAEGIGVTFFGSYYENNVILWELIAIGLLVILMLYVILTIQFESFSLPIIVMLTIPLGLLGAFTFLYVLVGSIDLMSILGAIVVLGLIVDDPILKIDTMNKILKKIPHQDISRQPMEIKKIIHDAGDKCLKPLLLVSLTTSISLVPILFIGGIGNEIQRPFAIVIIGGLTVGTFFTTCFVPLAYLYLTRIFK